MVSTQPYFEFSDTWIQVKDGNAVGRDLFSRHYSKYHYKDGRKPKLFVGPGEKMVLISKDGKALFVWRKFISKDNQTGINCSIFRNEGEIRSSELILETERLAWLRWPNERLYTYVNSTMIKSKNPGYCFKVAGWQFIGVTKKRQLHILEKFPFRNP